MDRCVTASQRVAHMTGGMDGTVKGDCNCRIE